MAAEEAFDGGPLLFHSDGQVTAIVAGFEPAGLE